MLRVEATGPAYETSWMGDVPTLDATAVQHEESVTVFAVNRSESDPLVVDVDLRAFPDLAVGHHTAVCDDDPEATNTADAPDRVKPRRLDDLKADSGRIQVTLPPLSWNMLDLHPAG